MGVTASPKLGSDTRNFQINQLNSDSHQPQQNSAKGLQAGNNFQVLEDVNLQTMSHDVQHKGKILSASKDRLVTQQLFEKMQIAS